MYKLTLERQMNFWNPMFKKKKTKKVLTEKPKDAGNQILSVFILALNHKRQLLKLINEVYFVLVSLKFSIIWLMP